MSEEEPKTSTGEPEKEEVKLDPSNPDVVTKYRKAGEIANAALAKVAAACVDGAVIFELCKIGDDFIKEESGKVYNKGKIEKGIGFPTCISVNQICGHFSPFSDDTVDAIKGGDVVKIDLGAQIDGFSAMVATTVYVKKEGEEKVTGKAADLLHATHNCAEAAIRLIKAGASSAKITEAVTAIAGDFKCSPVIGVLSHRMDRFKLDCEEVIINKEDEDNKVKDFEFEPLQVFGMDIVLSTGQGKTMQSEYRSTVFRRIPDSTYSLKMKASRSVFSEIKTNFPSHPFSLVNLENQKSCRVAMKECVDHKLVEAYPVVTEKDGELVAQVKFTAVLLPGGTIRITNAPIDTSVCESEYSVCNEELKALLATSAEKKKKKKNNKKKKKAAASSGGD